MEAVHERKLQVDVRILQRGQVRLVSRKTKLRGFLTDRRALQSKLGINLKR